MGRGNTEKNIWPSQRKWFMEDPYQLRVDEYA